MKKLYTILILITSLSSCISSRKMERVSIGMTKADVINSLGRPRSVSAQGGVEYLVYMLADDFNSALNGAKTEYYVRVINGKVESYGRMGDFDSGQIPTININQTSH